MGSMIHLAVGGLEIEWGKNGGFTDHSALFQASDLAQIPYWYVKGGWDAISSGAPERELEAVYRDGMSKPLGQVVHRIALLGFTFEYCARQYESDFYLMPDGSLSFDDLKSLFSEMDFEAISNGGSTSPYFHRDPSGHLKLVDAIRENRGVIARTRDTIEYLPAYTLLHLLALNPNARNLPVNWQFADVEEGGWATREEFARTLSQFSRFLIVTEGSSDAKIIQHAFRLLAPHIADFFDFVDMEEGYPFSGTGNLFRFLQGLISIKIQNNVVVIYDNDAEGVANYERSWALNVPDNMVILKLPDMEDFVGFDTIGPSGRHKADINGRAAAIECYLDLGPSALVRWTSFNIKMDAYQGELLNKTGYMRDFLDQRERIEGYDYDRIKAVLELIVANCVEMREAALDEGVDEAG
jgi:HEPN/Toprim N-terminal domain 1